MPHSVPRLVFHWRAFGGATVAYSVHIIHTPGPAMDKPSVNITATGTVPRVDRKFAVRLPCTGLTNGEIDFLLQVSGTQGKREGPFRKREKNERG